MSDPDQMSTPVFVSYSRRDKKWLERLQVHLKPLVRTGDIALWDDTRVRPGTNWKAELDRALASAQVAILMVSPDFLASDFIQDQELPVLLEAAERRGTRILPVILGHCLFSDSLLGRFQAINALDRPLEQLTKAGRDKALSDLARTIAAGLADEVAADVLAPPSSAPRTAPGPIAQTKGSEGAEVQSPRRSPKAGRAAQQLLGTGIFGSLLLAFLVAVFALAPPILPAYKHRILALCAALLAGLFGWFLSGAIGLRIESLKSRFGDVAIRATGGLALFVVVLGWWLSPLTPVGSGEIEKHEATDTGPAVVGKGIANTGSQTIEGQVTITGDGSSPPGEALAKPGSAAAGTGIANTGDQVIQGPVIIGGAPGEEQR